MSQEVCNKTGLNDPREAVRLFARQLLASRGEVPTDLYAIAKRLRVDSMTEESLPIDGMLVRENGKLSIKINSHSHPLRRRFTFAHEIGHIVLAMGEDADGKWQPYSCEEKEVEKLCDVIASEILMEEERVRQFFATRDFSVNNISAFASRFEVSLQAAVARVMELKLTRSTIAMLKKSDESQYFTVLWRKGRIKLDRTLFLPSLDACFTRNTRFRGRVLLDSHRREADLDAMRLGFSDFLLVSLH
ncbi:MAG: ImmA/IrrE family metallo-endopeptidase [Acidobacteria bacterium]|nr:ImmA/IrrE family metallo-endopeptidase [Acidobacteriota bacterium]